MNIPRDLMTAVSNTVSPTYLVGGSVRDCLLGRTPKDYDFCTPLLPDEVESLVKAAGRRAYTIGKSFGTIGFKVDGEFVEVTTFRQESYTDGSRRPTVSFVEDLTADLARRDLTINAMAMIIADNDTTVIDPFGGQHDLAQRTLRAVGSARSRIREDPLRMLRAARFASQLGFTIDDDLLAAMTRYAHLILTVSKERWMIELDKLLVGDNVELGLTYLAQTRLLQYLLPELAIQVDYDQDSPYHTLPLWDHTVKTVAGTAADVTLRWAALLHDIGKPATRRRNDKGYCNYIMHDRVGAELAEGIALRLKWSTQRRHDVTTLIRDHMSDDSPLRPADNAAK